MDLAYRILVAVVGATVVILGIIAMPYPGPGLLILLAGLAILGSEFQRAQQVLHWTRRRYDAWTDWLRGQRPLVRISVIALTGLIVLTTLWLVDTFGLVAGWIGLDWDWVHSPIV